MDLSDVEAAAESSAAGSGAGAALPRLGRALWIRRGWRQRRRGLAAVLSLGRFGHPTDHSHPADQPRDADHAHDPC